MRTRLLVILALAAASIAALAAWPPRLGMDLRGGTSLLLEVEPIDKSRPPSEVLAESRQIIERKINSLGLAETTLQSYGMSANRLLVQVPGTSGLDRLKEILQRQGKLEWRTVSDGPFRSEHEAFLKARIGSTIRSTGAGEWYVLDGSAVIQGSDLRNARAVADEFGRPSTAFTLSNQAAERFAGYTDSHRGQRAAVLLDDRIMTVAVIEDRIGQDGQIRGAGSARDAEDLAITLRAGSMPAKVRILHESTVDATLGADSVQQGVRAGIAGLAAIAAALLLYYGKAGLNAIAVLLLNGLLLAALLAAFDAVLTLPGIAGLILTIGMAVDSNVLIFERIREMREQRSGSAAIHAGFDRAWATIVDTHVTTIVSCALLFALGTAAVKGFAVTLALGLATNVFTAVWASRALFDAVGSEAP